MMRSGIAILLVGLTVVGLVAAGPVAGAVGGVADGDHVNALGPTAATDTVDADEDDADESDAEGNETLPGERLGGVVGVQAAEIDDEVESRSFERQVGADRSGEARGDAVANRLERAEARLAEIETRHEELRERRGAGEITEGEYRARTARLAAETAAIERSTNRSADVAAELPQEVREARGIDDDRIRTLRESARELSGPEVAEIARGIAGPNVGGPVGPGERPDHAGPPSMNETPGGPPSANETQGGPPSMNETRGGQQGNASDGPPSGADDGGSGSEAGNGPAAGDGEPGADSGAGSGSGNGGADRGGGPNA